ncbi:MAG: PASTA domain-containing protein [Chitinophagaceae bacterium]|nr:PASTA domain-containing protein [Chitinophagaceae bacterium]MCW5929324.1 PASTA domain-containing protein [Chitinophagaceae bacterium]
MLKVLSKKPFWLNLLILVIIFFLIIVLFFQSLRFFTHHGSYLKVPDVNNRNVVEATRLLEDMGFEVLVQDSVYYDTLPPLTVVKQFPDPDASVKVNRIVYLTVNRAVPPDVEMPNLVGMSFRNAEMELKSRGLKLGNISYKPDIAKNAVLEQIVQKDNIKPGTKITMGTTVSLVLGEGVGAEEIPVPDLFGMNFEEAVTLIEGNGFIVGSVVPDVTPIDTSAAFVFWQQPDRFSPDGVINRLRRGQMIDLRITPKRPEKNADPTNQGAGSNEY